MYRCAHARTHARTPCTHAHAHTHACTHACTHIYLYTHMKEGQPALLPQLLTRSWPACGCCSWGGSPGLARMRALVPCQVPVGQHTVHTNTQIHNSLHILCSHTHTHTHTHTNTLTHSLSCVGVLHGFKLRSVFW